MALHTPSIRTPTSAHHIPGWMLGVVALVAVLIIGLLVVSRPSAAPTTATTQSVAITQDAAAAQAYQQFRSGEREALNAPQLAIQAYLAYRAGERRSAAEQAALASAETQAAAQAWLAYRAGERIGPASAAQAAFRAWLIYRQGER
jgi:hypothetical protein